MVSLNSNLSNGLTNSDPLTLGVKQVPKPTAHEQYITDVNISKVEKQQDGTYICPICEYPRKSAKNSKCRPISQSTGFGNVL